VERLRAALGPNPPEILRRAFDEKMATFEAESHQLQVRTQTHVRDAQESHAVATRRAAAQTQGGRDQR
jgi:hypothetical protein